MKKSNPEYNETPSDVIDKCNTILFKYITEVKKLNPSGLLDCGADRGQWGDSWRKISGNMRPQGLYGIEIINTPKPEWYTEWFPGYSLTESGLLRKIAYDSFEGYGVAFGNPPHLLGEEMAKFVIDCIENFRVVGFMLPNDFQESQFNYRTIFKHKHCAEIHTSVNPINFLGTDDSPHRAFAFYIFDWHNKRKTEHHWFND